MGVPRKHAEVIKAWADGAETQCKSPCEDEFGWTDIKEGESPIWSDHLQYRVKPAKKQLWVRPYYLHANPLKPDSKGVYSVMSNHSKEELDRLKPMDYINRAEWIGPAVLIWEES